MPENRSVSPTPRVFRRALLDWFHRVRRDLPWRRTRDPYAIWVSEIMLQQTRVAAVLPYYERFLGRFPDIASLAAAPEAELLSYWAGLGYYSRARNLQRAAQQMKGSFPAAHDEILELPGVGAYTAAAVSSIAFGLPHAAVDGNVLRVLSRVTGEDGDIGSAVTRARLQEVADGLLDPEHPGDFNQAMMELGATVCRPRNPLCQECPVAKLCVARQTGRTQELPVKIRKGDRVQVEQTLLVVRGPKGILLRLRRETERLMPGFWELPDQEIENAVPGETLGWFRHSITYRDFVFRVAEARLQGRKPVGCQWFTFAEMKSMPITTVTRKALQFFS